MPAVFEPNLSSPSLPTSSLTNSDIFAKQLRRANRNAAFKTARQEVRRLEGLIEAQGEKVPDPDDSPGFLSTAFDVLDTGGQFVRGALAGGLGLEGFEGLSPLQAGLKGTREDVTVGKLLREDEFFRDHGVARGVAGFIGDVATDPLSYLSLGTASLVRAGGKALSKKAITKTGQTPVDLLGETTERLVKSGLDPLEAEKKVERIFRDARSVVSKTRALERPGIKQALAGNVDELKKLSRVDEQARLVRAELGLTDDIPLDELFAKPGIRLSGIFAGVGDGGIPLINARATDVPVLTEASEKLFDAIGGKLYNTSFKVATTLDAMQAKGGIAGDVASGILKARKLGGSARKLFSRTAEVGGPAKKELLDENEIARGFAMTKAEREADEIFTTFTDAQGNAHAWDALDLEAITRAYATSLEGLSEQARALATAKKGASFADLQPNLARGEEAIKRLADDFEKAVPGKGRAAVELLEKVKADWDDMLREGIADGTIDSTIKNYIPILFRDKAGGFVSPEFTKTAFKKFKKQNYSFERIFANIQDATLQAMGGTPEWNLRTLWTGRRFQQLRAQADKEFMERLAFEVALPPEMYAKLQRLALNHNVKTSQAARRLLSEQGFFQTDAWRVNAKSAARQLADSATQSGGAEGADDLAKLLKREIIEGEQAGEFGFKYIRQDNGDILNLDTYRKLKHVAAGEGSEARRAQEFLERISKGADEDTLVANIRAQEAVFEAERPVLLGRAGEGPLSRAGATRVPDLFWKEVKDGLDPDTRRWYEGILPESYVNVIQDSLDTKSAIGRLVKSAERGDPMAQALSPFAKGYLSWVKHLKIGSTLIWPSYLVRNVGSGQFQGMEVASTLGEQLNPLRLWDNYQLLKGRSKFVQEGTGRVLEGKQMLRELDELGVRTGIESAIELASHQMDALTGKVNNPSFIKKGWTKYASFAEALENYGRAHLYIGLRRQGHTARSAAHLTNRVMVDYARGKSSFERKWINNVIFFYSFARGQATNTMIQLMTKPGALTSQLHAVNGVREMMLNDIDSITPDIEGEISTIRSRETLSRYLGKNKEGVDEVLMGVGVPVEDLSRFLTFRVPKSMKMGDIFDAAADGSQRFVQTALASANPMIRFPIEVLGAKKNFFFDTPITSEFLRKVPKAEGLYKQLITQDPNRVPATLLKGVDASVREVFDARDNGDGTFTVDPYRLAILTYLIPGASRAVSTGNFLAKPGAEKSDKLLRLFTGIRTDEVDPEKSEVFKRREQLEEFIEREGLLRSKRRIRQRDQLLEASE